MKYSQVMSLPIEDFLRELPAIFSELMSGKRSLDFVDVDLPEEERHYHIRTLGYTEKLRDIPNYEPMLDFNPRDAEQVKHLFETLCKGRLAVIELEDKGEYDFTESIEGLERLDDLLNPFYAMLHKKYIKDGIPDEYDAGMVIVAEKQSRETGGGIYSRLEQSLNFIGQFFFVLDELMPESYFAVKTMKDVEDIVWMWAPFSNIMIVIVHDTDGYHDSEKTVYQPYLNHQTARTGMAGWHQFGCSGCDTDRGECKVLEDIHDRLESARMLVSRHMDQEFKNIARKRFRTT